MKKKEYTSKEWKRCRGWDNKRQIFLWVLGFFFSVGSKVLSEHESKKNEKSSSFSPFRVWCVWVPTLYEDWKKNSKFVVVCLFFFTLDTKILRAVYERK